MVYFVVSLVLFGSAPPSSSPLLYTHYFSLPAGKPVRHLFRGGPVSPWPPPLRPPAFRGIKLAPPTTPLLTNDRIDAVVLPLRTFFCGNDGLPSQTPFFADRALFNCPK